MESFLNSDEKESLKSEKVEGSLFDILKSINGIKNSWLKVSSPFKTL